MTTPFDHASESLRAELEAKGVRYALASFVDLHGVSKAKAVPLAHLGQMLAGSELFTGAALDGVPQEVSDNEVAAVPDPGTCTVLPWQPEVAWFASDLHLQGEPFGACSRNILHRVRAEAAAMGFRFNLGIETEFLPDFNHDLLISFPWLMSNHWFFKRDLLIELHGFDELAGKFFELDFILKFLQCFILADRCDSGTTCTDIDQCSEDGKTLLFIIIKLFFLSNNFFGFFAV
jgi:hypothetical protein